MAVADGIVPGSGQNPSQPGKCLGMVGLVRRNMRSSVTASAPLPNCPKAWPRLACGRGKSASSAIARRKCSAAAAYCRISISATPRLFLRQRVIGGNVKCRLELLRGSGNFTAVQKEQAKIIARLGVPRVDSQDGSVMPLCGIELTERVQHRGEIEMRLVQIGVNATASS